jgi:hypothetical protein
MTGAAVTDSTTSPSSSSSSPGMTMITLPNQDGATNRELAIAHPYLIYSEHGITIRASIITPTGTVSERVRYIQLAFDNTNIFDIEPFLLSIGVPQVLDNGIPPYIDGVALMCGSVFDST